VWVLARSKRDAVIRVKELVARATKGESFSFKSPEVQELNSLYEWKDTPHAVAVKQRISQRRFQF
jgi:hypothetical protein